MRTEICFLVAVVLLATPGGTRVSSEKFIRFCYIHNSVKNLYVQLLFVAKDINVHLCTHFIYAHARIDIDGLMIKALPTLEEGPTGIYRQLVDMKKQYPSVKLMISLGGPAESNKAFDDITSSDAKIGTFTSRTARFLYNQSFDGLDIDWQFPNSKSRKENLSKLLKAFKKVFNEDETEHPMLLTLAGPGLRSQVDAGYDVPEIALYVDYVLVKAYNLVQPLNLRATFSSPLFNDPKSSLDPTLNVNYTVRYWHKKGLAYHKLVVGLTAVGRYLKLANRTQSTPGSPVTAEVLYGRYSRVPSGMMYPEICSLLQTNRSQRHFDDTQKNPYLVINDSWIGYEDAESFGIKVDWMISLDVAGYMFDGVHQDDFSGQFCKGGKYPLLNAIYDRTMDIVTEKDMTTTTEEESLPSKGEESSTVLAVLGFVFVLVAGVTAYGLFVFLTKQDPLVSLSE